VVAAEDPVSIFGRRSRFSEGIEVAVIVPLEDPRGDVVEHLRTWTHGQVLARERYQLVVGASGEHPEFERRVAELLAPQDAIVPAPGASLMGLYEAAARAARAPVLVLTEAHCSAEPECLAAVTDAFETDRELDAATLEYWQNASTDVGELSKRWFARVFEAWDRAGWARLEVAGSAIRTEAYARAGGLDPRLELFAGAFMSARLQEQGARVAHLERAVVKHELEDEMGHSLSLSRSYALGECTARAEHDPEFCERHFGPAGLWGRRLAYRPEIARPMVAALTSAARQSPRDEGWLARELVARLPARLAGTRLRRAWERSAAALHRAVADSDLFPVEVRWRSYVAAHEATVRASQLRWSAQQNGLPTPPVAPGGGLGAERLDGVLVGAHGLERERGRRFRWTEPVALLRMVPPAEGALLRVDTGGLRGPPLDHLLGIYVAGEPLPPEQISGDEEALEARLPARFAQRAAGAGIVLVCRPFVPSRAGSTDRRRLGIPVVELAISPA
jgi:Glycosyltransferase like family 2